MMGPFGELEFLRFDFADDGIRRIQLASSTLGESTQEFILNAAMHASIDVISRACMSRVVNDQVYPESINA